MLQQLTRLLIDVLSTVVPYGILLATIVWIVLRKYRPSGLRPGSLGGLKCESQDA